MLPVRRSTSMHRRRGIVETTTDLCSETFRSVPSAHHPLNRERETKIPKRSQFRRQPAAGKRFAGLSKPIRVVVHHGVPSAAEPQPGRPRKPEDATEGARKRTEKHLASPFASRHRAFTAPDFRSERTKPPPMRATAKTVCHRLCSRRSSKLRHTCLGRGGAFARRGELRYHSGPADRFGIGGCGPGGFWSRK